MPCGWEGNRRSGVALAMRHRLQWFIHLRAHGLRKGPRLHWSPITSSQGCRGYGDGHGCGYGVSMGMMFHFHPHRPMGILWGFLINLK